MSKLTVKGKVIANFFDVSERTIRNWVQKGMPRVADGVYSPKDCFNWWNEFVNEASIGENDDNKDVKERYWSAKAGNEELKFEKTKGKLVDREDVERAFSARAYELSLSFRALKYRLPPVLEGKSREEMQNELSKELTRILESYKRAGNFIPEGLGETLADLKEQEKDFSPKTKTSKVKKSTKSVKRAKK